MSQNNQNKAEGEIVSILSVIPQLKVTRFEIEKKQDSQNFGSYSNSIGGQEMERL